MSVVEQIYQSDKTLWIGHNSEHLLIKYYYRSSQYNDVNQLGISRNSKIFYVTLLIIFMIIPGAYSASEPLGEQKVRTTQIEAGTIAVTTIYSNTGSNNNMKRSQFNVTFKETKNNAISNQHVVYSIIDFNYDIFSDSPYFLFFITTISQLDQNRLTFQVLSRLNKQLTLEIRYLVIDPNFPDENCFEIKEFTFSSSNIQIQHELKYNTTQLSRFKYANYITSLALFSQQSSNLFYSQSVNYSAFIDSGATNNTHLNIDFIYNTNGIGNITLCTVQAVIFYEQFLTEPTNYYQTYVTDINQQQSVTDQIGWLNFDFNPSETLYIFGLKSISKNNDQGQFSFLFDQSNLKMATTNIDDSQFMFFAINVYSDTIQGCYNPEFQIKRQIAGITPVEYECHDSCNQGEYLTYNSSEEQYQCNDCTISHCKNCQSDTNCIQCDPGYQLSLYRSPLRQQCTRDDSYYRNTTDSNFYLCSNEIDNCHRCRNSSGTLICTECQNGYYINSTDSSQPCFSSCSDFTANCLKCNSTHCIECEPQYDLISSSTACLKQGSVDLTHPPQPTVQGQGNCTDTQRCQQCAYTNVSHCTKCFNENMTVIDGKCKMVCGDGIVGEGYEQCDDGNTENFDGCSFQCNLETQDSTFECLNQTIEGDGRLMTQCTLNKQIVIQLQSLQKATKENKLLVYLSISEPLIKEWVDISSDQLLNDLLQVWLESDNQTQSQNEQLQWSYSLKFVYRQNAHIKDHSESRRLLEQQSYEAYAQQMRDSYSTLLLEVDYSLSSNDYGYLNHRIMHLSFDPKSSQYSVFTNTAATNLSFALVADNNQILQYYDADYYGFYSFVKYAAYFVTLVTNLMLIVSIVFGGIEKGNGASLMVLEFCGVPQLLFVYLVVMGEFNPLMSALAEGLQFINGVSTDFLVFDPETETLSRQLAAVGYSSPHVADNSAAVVCILSLILIVGLTLKIIVWRMINRLQELKEFEAKYRHNKAQSQLNSQQFGDISENSLNAEVSIESLEAKANFLLINVGFVLQMFFSYGLLVNVCIQIFYADSFHMLDFVILGMTVVIFLVYGFLWTFKGQTFKLLTWKVKDAQAQQSTETLVSKTPQNQQSSECCCVAVLKSNPKFYLLMYFLERILNGISVVALSTFTFQNFVPLLLNSLLAVAFCKRSFYSFAQNIRILIVLIAGFSVQALLLYRKLTVHEDLAIDSVGSTEDFVNQYSGLTMILTLVVALFCTLIYALYSFKKFRCCDLEIEKQKRASKKGKKEFQLSEQRKKSINLEEQNLLNDQNRQTAGPNQKLNAKMTSNQSGNQEEGQIEASPQRPSQKDKPNNRLNNQLSKEEVQRNVKNQMREETLEYRSRKYINGRRNLNYQETPKQEEDTAPKGYYHRIKGDIYLMEEEFAKI